MARRLLLFFAILFSASGFFPLYALINFSSLDISSDNRLLFKLEHYGAGTQETLFLSNIEDRSIRQMTTVPERMDLIDGGRILQIQNALGTTRVSSRGGFLVSMEGFPRTAVYDARVNETLVSPNGRWILSLLPDTGAYGTLVLSDVTSGNTVTIATDIERPDRGFPASWSPDSRVFVYARHERLYYFNVNFGAAVIDERFRLVGEGTINSIAWDKDSDFFYLSGSLIYRVRTTELFTRALYSSFIDIGAMAGRLPFDFDPAFDEFWISPDSASLLLSKGGRNIFYFQLHNDDYYSVESGIPYLVLPRSCFEINVLWSASGGITVLASVIREGVKSILSWRLNPERQNAAFVQLSAPFGGSASLSPDGKTVLFWGEKGIALYDYTLWRNLVIVSDKPAYSCIWTGNNEIITGGSERIERIILFPGDNGRIISRELICLSRVDRFGFEEHPVRGSSRIFAQNDGVWFVTDGRSQWTETASPHVRQTSLVSDKYRVYLEKQSSGVYENIPMIRNTMSVGTFSILPEPLHHTGSVASGSSVASGNSVISIVSDTSGVSADNLFTHGRRDGPREIGLCFDLYDDAEGLPEVLDALNRYGVKATFFISGEFIRRYPDAVRDIAAAGHEPASMFFATINLSDSRYQIDENFIARGLARNEDEYFNTTGKELALIWHPPWYASSQLAVSAAAATGYVTSGRDVDPLDWVSREDEKKFGLPHYSAAEMIDRIMGLAAPGSIIPVRLGILPEGRANYLFRCINVLLDAITRENYTIVPVSQLIAGSRNL